MSRTVKHFESAAAGMALYLLASGAVPLHAAGSSADPSIKPRIAPIAESKIGWFNATELSVVLTDGNASTQTFGFDNTLRRVWERSRFQFKVDYVRADTADDAYMQVEPGLTFLPGQTPVDPPATLVKPPVEPDVEQILIEADYAREITRRLFWSVGGSWDRNEDAGIASRYLAFGGVGNVWWDLDDIRLSTSYGLSYTDRDETPPDPEKEKTFGGVRLEFDFRMKIGAVTTFQNVSTGNVNFKDLGDYTLDVSNAVSVKMSKHLALKVSLQWQVNSEPALDDVDLIARVIVIDPDGTPGNGDEYFETVSSGGSELTLGETTARREDLDTLFRTTLVIDF
jgi:post-segregation antitoxin (ccd killing protein)